MIKILLLNIRIALFFLKSAWAQIQNWPQSIARLKTKQGARGLSYGLEVNLDLELLIVI